VHRGDGRELPVQTNRADESSPSHLQPDWKTARARAKGAQLLQVWQ
jgi:hypothetical protein